jgi:hypothetical protein
MPPANARSKKYIYPPMFLLYGAVDYKWALSSGYHRVKSSKLSGVLGIITFGGTAYYRNFNNFGKMEHPEVG